MLHDVPRSVEESDAERIEIRCLGCPLACMHDGDGDASELHPSTLWEPLVHHGSLVVSVNYRCGGEGVRGGDMVSLRVIQCCKDRESVALATAEALQLRVYLQQEIAVCIVSGYRAHSEIAYMELWRMEQGDITVYAAKAPSVLVLKVRAVAILVDCQGYGVLPLCQERGYIEL